MPNFDQTSAVNDGTTASPPEKNLAADLIRQKLNGLYGTEPDAAAEAAEIAKLSSPRSPHQEYMYSLSISGKSPAEIQIAWHEYYQALPDEEKHKVWREFYINQRLTGNTPLTSQQQPKIETPVPVQPVQNYYHQEKFVSTIPVPKKPRSQTRSVAEIKRQILGRVQSASKVKAKRHLQSLIFGLGVGSLVVLIFLFSFFNERFIAPLITPSRNVSATPIIINNSDLTVSDPVPKVIIPKINVEIPVVYDEPSIEEAAIQSALERGVVHYATTSAPGEQGNVVIFGHSSNNIFNQGRYKFAFVLLSRLEQGDTFYLTKDGKRYAYRVYQKKIVKPNAVEVMGPTDRAGTATLITCDPPGTSLNRLVVVGEQISPDPSVNVASSAPAGSSTPSIVPSNAPSLWQRITGWL